MKKHLNTELIKKIFNKNNLGEIRDIQKLNIGFTNDIYLVNGKYILKVCIQNINEKNFEKEIYLYRIFKNKIPVPDVLISDTSKKIIPRFYTISKKISGDNLYSKWHLLSDKEKREILKQACEMIKIINKTSYTDFAKKFNLNQNIDWHKKKYSSIKKFLKKVEFRKIISKEFIAKIKKFIEENHKALHKQKLGLVYWDLHFDNILISNNKIAGFLDFEGIDIMSIDFILDSVRRLTNYPSIYASEEYEKLVKKKDYSKILRWFKEFYPELFNFKNLNKRLDLYSIEYDLRLLLDFPHTKSLKKRLAKTINLSKMPRK